MTKVECTKENPCFKCTSTREPGTSIPVPKPPGPARGYLRDGWWQGSPIRWWGRGMPGELGFRAMNALVAEDYSNGKWRVFPPALVALEKIRNGQSQD